MQQTGETTSIPKVDPSKTHGFQPLAAHGRNGLVNTQFEQGKLVVHLGSKDGKTSPEIVKKLAIFVP